MTSKFSIDDKELLQRISSGEAVVGLDFGNLIVRELAAFRLAAMDSEPVGEVIEVGDALLVEWHKNLEEGAKLYTTPQAPVIPFGLHLDTQKLVTDFCTALAEKLYKAQLKYGYDADWKQGGWPSQCQAHFHQHIAKGDPRDVAAYCAFMWYHGWKTEAAQPAPVVPKDVMPGGLVYSSALPKFESNDSDKVVGYCCFISGDTRIVESQEQAYADAKAVVNDCRAAMLQENAKSAGVSNNCRSNENVQVLQAGNSPAHSVLRPEQISGSPAQDGNSPAQSPIDHGYRPACECSGCKATARICAELAGNSPVIPDGYVMVPKEPTKEMIDAGWLHFMGTKNPSSKGTYKAMLAAAPQEVNHG